jgi:glc operon protein GlcG
MRTRLCLTTSDAHKVMSACKSKAHEEGWKVSIAIVDEGGYLLQLERLDGAGLTSPEVAILKARTAALSRSETKTLEDIVKERPATSTFPGRVPVQGGVPILYEGECIGGIGVSGVKSAEDERVAQAGLTAIK